MKIISKENATHYTWDDNCDGWKLVTSKNLSVIEESVPPGSTEVKHYHSKSEQFFFVLSGIATMETDTEILEIRPDQGIHIPAGIVHQLSNRHNHALKFLVISTPPSHGDRVEV